MRKYVKALARSTIDNLIRHSKVVYEDEQAGCTRIIDTIFQSGRQFKDHFMVL